MDLYIQKNGISFTEAYDELAPRYGLNGADPRPAPARQAPKRSAQPEAPTPVPDDAPDFVVPAGATAVYEYRDRDDRLLYYRVRTDKLGGGKFIVPYTLVDREWTKKGPSGLLSLYRLETLSKFDPTKNVFVVEGEKCADALGAILKRNAVLSPAGGCGSYGKADWSPLAGRRVVIWPDADEAGQKAAEVAKRELLRLGCRVTVLKIPDNWLNGYDAADAIREGWIGKGKGKLSNLKELLEKSPEESPQAAKADDQAPTPTTADQPEVSPDRGIAGMVRRFSGPADLLAKPTPPAFVVDGLLPASESGLVFGAGKVGKSTVTRAIAIAVASGTKFAGRMTAVGPVAYVCAEDSTTHVQNALRVEIRHKHQIGQLTDDDVERLARNLYLLEVRGSGFRLVEPLGPGFGSNTAVVSPKVTELAEWMKDTRDDWRLIFFDTASRLLDGDESNPNLAQLVNAVEVVCERTGAAGGIVHHSGKAASRQVEIGPEAARGGSSLAFNARSVLQVVHFDLNRGNGAMALDQGIVVPQRESIDHLELPGTHRDPDDWAANVIGLIPVALNAGRLARPMWFIRHDSDVPGYPILSHFEFRGSLDQARAEQAADRDRKKAQAREIGDNRDVAALLHAFRLLTTGQAGEPRDATATRLGEVAGWGRDKTKRVLALAVRRSALTSEEFTRGGRSMTRYRLGEFQE